MGTEGEKRRRADGDRTETALHASPSLQALGKKKKKKAERTNVTLYCLVVSITFSSEEIYLGQARRKKNPKTCGCNVTLLRMVLGGIQSKPGAPTATGQEPAGTRGDFPGAEQGLGLSYCTALMHGEHPQPWVGRGRGLLLLLLDSLHLSRMDQNPVSVEMTKEHLRVGSPVGFSRCLSQRKRHRITAELFQK